MGGILQNFVAYLKHKYGPIQIDDECVAQRMNAGLRTVAAPWRDLLDRPIKLEELISMIHRETGNKAPGRNGRDMAFSR
jgi:hypothetical protein